MRSQQELYHLTEVLPADVKDGLALFRERVLSVARWIDHSKRRGKMTEGQVHSMINLYASAMVEGLSEVGIQVTSTTKD